MPPESLLEPAVIDQTTGEPDWAKHGEALPELAHLIRAYVQSSPGCVVHEVATMYQVVPKTVLKHVRTLERHKLVRTKQRHGRLELHPHRPPRPRRRPIIQTRQQEVIRCADLFCGMGGFSAGMAAAFEELGENPADHVDLVAINHWDKAIKYHAKNHPWARHGQEAIEEAQPLEWFPDGYLDLLVVSPSCTHHSSARGGKPVDDGLRSHAWAAVRWARDLDVSVIIVENVPEFVKWSPLEWAPHQNCRMRCGRCKGTGQSKAGRSCKSCSSSGKCDVCNNTGRYKKATNDGSWFRAWIKELRRLGYEVDWRVNLNAADYGAATSRKRFFLVARKDGRAIQWPKQTHSKDGKVPGTKRWRGSQEIIDWSLAGESIFTRKKKLAWNTMVRIAMGVYRYNGVDIRPVLAAMYPDKAGKMPAFKERPDVITAQPYGVQFQGTSTAFDFDRPLPGFTAGGGKLSILTPRTTRFSYTGIPPYVAPLESQQQGGVEDFLALVEPHVTEYYSNGRPHGVEAPLPTATTKDRQGLVEPCIIDHFGSKDNWGARIKGTDEPVPTLTGNGRWELVEPVIVRSGGRESLPTSVRQPIHNIETREHYAVAQPMILGQHGGAALRPVQDPLPTVAGGGAIQVMQAMLLPPNGIQGGLESNQAKPLDQPVPTITAGRGGQMGILEPHVHQHTHGGRHFGVDQPLPTITTAHRGELAVAQPGAFLYPNHGEAPGQEPRTHSIDEPVPTITTTNNARVIMPVLYTQDGVVIYDITMRMMAPRELADAMGFPESYILPPSKTTAIKMIGNAVQRHIAKALIKANVDPRRYGLDAWLVPAA